MKTLYEINWHHTDKERTKSRQRADKEQTKFSHCTVTPITILREGILPGCTGVSITAKDSEGRTFQGSPRDYFESEAAAWDNVKSGLMAMADDNEAYIADLKAEVIAIRAFLDTLPAPEDKS